MKKVRLLEAYPVLGAALSENARAQAAEELLVTEHRMETGVWVPRLDVPSEVLGLLVFEGFVTREVSLGAGRSAELLGRGDVLRPWQEEASSFGRVRWEVLEPTRVAMLDPRLSARLSRWPVVLDALLEQCFARSRDAAVRTAIMATVGVDRRLLLLFWLLAERWGKLSPDGVQLTICLSHRLLAALVGVCRPTASTALGRLERNGLVTRARDGRWLLHGSPPALPADGQGDGTVRQELESQLAPPPHAGAPTKLSSEDAQVSEI